MYVFLIPAQGVGQNVHRLVERDIPEIQKKVGFTKTLHGFRRQLSWPGHQKKMFEILT